MSSPTSLTSRIRQFTSKDLQLKLKEIYDKFVQSAIKSNPDLDISDLRSIGKMSRHIVELDSDTGAFTNTIDKTKQFYFPAEGPGFPDLSFWFMMDHLGTTIRDISGNQHHGTLLGHPSPIRLPIDMGFLQLPGAPGFPGIQFNVGADSTSATEGEAIQVPDHPDIQTSNKTNGFTYTFNFISIDYSQHTGPGFNFNRRFLNKRDDANNGNVLAFGSGGDVEFSVTDGGTEYVMDLEALSIDTYYRVAARYDPDGGPTSADRISMFLNGSDQSSGSTTGLFLLPELPNTDLYIASRDQGLGWFRGVIQDLRMYNRALTDTEILNLHTNGLTILDIDPGEVAMLNQFVAAPPP